MSKKSARTFNQVDDSKSDDELYIYIYPIYSGADSDHTKHLVDPQLSEGGAVSGQQNYANRL